MGSEDASHDALEPVAVLGVGVEGRATIDYLLRHGIEQITALDGNQIDGLPTRVEGVFGDRHAADLGRFATVFRSPGIRPDHPALERARQSGTRVTTAVQHFLERCPCPVIGVTGTVGKGTCSSLLAVLLEAAGRTVHLGGNIGLSPLAFAQDVRSDQIVVLEISSFQAMDLSVSPTVGVILRTTSEHLDWHRDTVEYRAAKAQLLAHQRPDQTVIFNADSRGAAEIAATSAARRLAFSLAGEIPAGLFLAGDELRLRLPDVEQTLPLDIDRVQLPGRFNLENVAAALLAAIVAGADGDRICGSAESFVGLPHRVELVVEANGIRYYNDSYATRPEATIAALSAFEGPLAMIIGGSEKHADFGPLVAALAEHPGLRRVSLIGATSERLAAAIAQIPGRMFDVGVQPDLDSAMGASAAALTDGGVVLMSPACASFGLFKNYKDRGERFRASARALAGE